MTCLRCGKTKAYCTTLEKLVELTEHHKCDE